MNSKKRLKIVSIPTDKLVVMVDVSRREFNKQLTNLKAYQKSESSLPENLEENVKLWKNRYDVSFSELRRRVEKKFISVES